MTTLVRFGATIKIAKNVENLWMLTGTHDLFVRIRQMKNHVRPVVTNLAMVGVDANEKNGTRRVPFFLEIPHSFYQLVQSFFWTRRVWQITRLDRSKVHFFWTTKTFICDEFFNG